MSSEVDALMSQSERRKPAFITTQNLDGLVAAVMRLAMEVSTLRDRLDVYEALAEHHGVGGDAAMEAFEPDPTLTATRQSRRARLVELLVRDLTALE